MAKSYSRGHQILFKNNQWVYSDNLKPIDDNRPCKKCGNKPTVEGYDHCIGNIEDVISVCCGHGVNNKILI